MSDGLTSQCLSLKAVPFRFMTNVNKVDLALGIIFGILLLKLEGVLLPVLQ